MRVFSAMWSLALESFLNNVDLGFRVFDMSGAFGKVNGGVEPIFLQLLVQHQVKSVMFNTTNCLQGFANMPIWLRILLLNLKILKYVKLAYSFYDVI